MAKAAQIIGLIVFTAGLYYFIISFFGLGRRRIPESREPETRFAVLIAAHNEERVIASLVENLLHVDYPRELYDVIVIADNCDDQTANMARKAGGNVWERFNPAERGKGFALQWAFDRIFADSMDYDAVLVIDADNLVDLSVLRIINNHLLAGEEIVQSYLDSKNPGDTWITRSIHVGYVITNRLMQLAKYNLGFSSALGGTGMCIKTDLLKRIGWGTESLTEDLEFQIKALLNGVPVCWAHDAVIFDEKPLTLIASWNQRKRWMQGHFSVARRYAPRLFLEGIKQRSMSLIDAGLYCINPFFMMLSGVGMILGLLAGAEAMNTAWAPVLLGVTILQFLYYMTPLFFEPSGRKAILWVILFPFFAITWIPVAFAGFATQTNRVWNHTLHTRGIRFNELARIESAIHVDEEIEVPGMKARRPELL